MKLRNGAEYIDSLQQINPEIYYLGKRIKNIAKHPATASHVRAAAMTYSLANNPKYKDLATAVSRLSGHRISRFTHVH